MTLSEQLNLAEEKCAALRKAAHEAPLNPYRVNADGHRWVEQVSYAYRDRANEWLQACLARDLIKAEMARGSALSGNDSKGGAA